MYHNECLLNYTACKNNDDIRIANAGSCNSKGQKESDNNNEQVDKSDAFDTNGDDENVDDITDEDKEILRDDEKDTITISPNTAVVEEGN